MKKTLLLIMAVIIAGMMNLQASEAMYSIVFGAENQSSNTLDNGTFIDVVKSGKTYINGVTSVLAAFPELESVKLSSNKQAGGFNIELTQAAQVKASKLLIKAYRIDNDRDKDASLMVNSETVLVPSTEPQLYEIVMQARPLKTLTNIIVKATGRVFLQEICVVYDDEEGEVPVEKQKVSSPVFTPGAGTVSAGTLVEIVSATPGATIYYSIDGTDPTSSSTIYLEPVLLNEDTQIRAYAIKEGMEDSDISVADYTVVSQAFDEYLFNFAEPETLNPGVAKPASKESVELDGRTFSEGDVTVTFAATGNGNTKVRLYGSYDAGCNLRVYDGDSFIVRTLNASYYIKEVLFDVAISGEIPDVDLMADTGEYIWESCIWTAGEEMPKEVTFTSIQQSRISTMTVKLGQTTGITDTDTVVSEGVEEWFTIDGTKVSAPDSKGLYICCHNGIAKKVLVR